MTLSRQLVLLVALLVLLLFVGTFVISAYNTRDYLENQLASHAQDAATSLGLSATNHMAEGDEAIVSSMVNAMIHRGDYLNIRLENMQGEVWIERGADSAGGGVPDWFRGLFTLQPPEGKATMMSGWRQVGNVYVVSHPGLAYRKLWDNSRETLSWFVVGALVVLLLGLVLLRFLLRPLRQVEWQAEAICNRDFPVVEARPFTLEFRRVVEAMNRLSRKVSQMLVESERLASRLREQAYQDPVTGLANRRQFLDVLTDRVEDVDAFYQGGVLLLQLNEFKRYNQEYGYQAGDELLRRIGELLRERTAHLGKVTLAHMAGADFALLIEDADDAAVATLAEQLADNVSALFGEIELPSADVAHIGGVVYRGQTVSELLADADLALRQAQQDAANAWALHIPDEDSAGGGRSATEWRELIEEALRAKSLKLLRQPVVSTSDRSILHHEVFLRLLNPHDDREVLPAGIFMPVAESTGLASEIDKAVLQMVVEQLESAEEEGAIAVNMSPSSLTDEATFAWVSERLLARPEIASRIILEWPEYGATAHVPELKAWIDKLSPIGVRFSLDHFGKGFASFAYLKELKADFLKIDGSFLQSLESETSNQFFLQAVSKIARGLELQVIAESVETESVWMQLPELGVDGGRGYWLGRPE